ncbi:MAG: hypothetical protein V4519_04390 [Patescibacteria group bacterium]
MSLLTKVYRKIRIRLVKALTFVLIVATLFGSLPSTLTLPLLTPNTARAETTGNKVPASAAAVTSNAGDNNGFETGAVSAVSADDGSYMSSTNTNSSSSIDECALTTVGADQHDFYDFTLGVTPNSTIDGITVTANGNYDSNSGANYFCVFLSHDGGTSWTTGINSADIGTADVTSIYGGSSDTWGRTWTADELSNANFRVRVMTLVANTLRDAELDYLAVEVDYTVNQTPLALTSASNETYAIGQGATAIPAITVVGNTNVTAANDIRIAIDNDSGFNYLWDTSDTTASISGTGSSKVSGTVSYEDSGRILVINVTSDFADAETIAISGLSYTSFSGSAKTGTGALKLYVDGVSDTVVDATDTATVTIKGSAVLANHTLSQVTDKFQNEETATTTELYRFALTNTGESASTSLSFDLSSVAGITTSDITNAELHLDINGDGIVAPDGSWTTSYDTPLSDLQSLEIDTTNNILYAGGKLGGIIYRCDFSTECDSESDWTLSLDSPGVDVWDILFDSNSGVLYAGTGSSGIIYRCDTTTSCNESSDWTTSYDDPSSIYIITLGFDSVNNVLYAGGDSYGVVMRCATSTGCNEQSDWTTSLDSAGTHMFSLTFDPTNEVMYVSSENLGIIYRCETSTNCDDTADWTVSLDTTETGYRGIGIDTRNNVLYAGSYPNGIIYRCDTSTNCDASGDWSIAVDTAAGYTYSVTVNTVTNKIYAGTGQNADLYECDLTTACDASGEWTLVYDQVLETSNFSYPMVVDVNNNIMYSSGNDQGIILRKFAGDPETSQTGIVEVTGSTGSITFTSASLPIGTHDYILKGTVSNIGPGDTMTVGLSTTNMDSTGDVSGQTLSVTGSATNVTHAASSLITIESAINETYELGQGTTAIPAVSVVGNTNVTAANDIRIAIDNDSGFNYLWDTSDTTASISGTGSSKVSGTVSYEDSGRILVINVTSDFADAETIAISGLSYTSFSGSAKTGTGALKLYVDGVSDTVVDATDTATVTIKGSSTLSNNSAGQVLNKFQSEDTSTTTELYGFQITNAGESSSVALTFDLSSITGISSGDITNASVYADKNNDGAVSSVGSVTTSFDGTESNIYAIVQDTENEVLYAGTDTNGIIYRCMISTGCDASGDWTVSYDTSESTINSLTYDSVNNIIYAGSGSGGIIFRCDTTTGCDASGDWTTSYDTSATTIDSLMVDSVNNIIYAGSGSGGIIFRCDATTGCNESGDWTTSYDTTATTIYAFTMDTNNNIIYAGSGSGGVIFRCDTTTGCDASGDWTTSYDTSALQIRSMVFDSISSVLYAGSGTDGILYRCDTTTGCDASGDWTVSNDTVYTSILSLLFDSETKTLYYGSSGGGSYVYKCVITTGCDASGDWTYVTVFGEEAAYSMVLDSKNGVLYISTGTSGRIYRRFLGDPQIFTSPTTSIIGATGTITFPATTVPNGVNDFILKATVSNIVTNDTITFGLTNSNITSTGTVSGVSLTVTGSASNATHIAASPISITSDANQTFYMGQASTPISPITLVGGSALTATNNIRIAIATTTGFTYLWDTTDTTATISGTGSSKVSTTVSYEGGGSVLVIDVTSNFALETIIISGLSYTNFTGVAYSGAGALKLFTDGPTDSSSDVSDTQTVSLIGGSILSSHSSSQVTNKFLAGSTATTTRFFRFNLNTLGERASTTLTFDLSSVSGISDSDMTDFVVYSDLNNDGSISAATSWSTGYSNTTDSTIETIIFDERNRVIYTGGANGRIYRCVASSGCDASGDWTTSLDSTESTINSLIIDTTNNVLYAGSGTGGIIYRCALSTSCDASGDWTTSYDTADSTIYSFGFDAANGVLYAGTGSQGYILRCNTSTGCDAMIDWQLGGGYDSTESSIYDFVVDSVSNIIYASTGSNGLVYRCETSTGCDAALEWTTSFDSPESDIYTLSIDTENRILYAGSGTGGIIYRCALSTSCDASEDWTTSYDTSNSNINSLVFDSVNNVMYAATGETGVIYSCETSSGCDASGDWVISHDSALTSVQALAYDSIRNVVYAGAYDTLSTNVVVYRKFSGDQVVFNSPTISIGGSTGTIAFTATSTLPVANLGYILYGTVSNLVEDDTMTVGLTNSKIFQSGVVSGSTISATGSVANAIHTMAPLVIGSLTILNHTIGQISDQFIGVSSISGSPLFRFQLLPTDEDISINRLIFNLVSLRGFIGSDITAAEIVQDTNSDGVLNEDEPVVAEAGEVLVSGNEGSITFNNQFTSDSVKDYFLKLSVSNIAISDEILISVNRSSVTAVGQESNTSITPLVSVTPVFHYRIGANAGPGAGAGMFIGDPAPEGDGEQTGGGNGGGDGAGEEAPPGDGNQGGGGGGGGSEAFLRRGSSMFASVWSAVWEFVSTKVGDMFS